MDVQKKMERSVDSLQRLYAGVVALALAQGISRLIFADMSSGQLLAWSDVVIRLPGFLSFFVVLVPFIHGMNRHLDDCYLRAGQPDVPLPPGGALLFDFFTFFIQAALLFVISTTLAHPLRAFVLIGILLGIDVVWAFVAWCIHYRNPRRGFRDGPLPWLVVNASAMGLGLLLGLPRIYEDSAKPWILLVVAVGRTTADYVFSWKFYFPRGATTEREVP